MQILPEYFPYTVALRHVLVDISTEFHLGCFEILSLIGFILIKLRFYPIFLLYYHPS